MRLMVVCFFLICQSAFSQTVGQVFSDITPVSRAGMGWNCFAIQSEHFDFCPSPFFAKERDVQYAASLNAMGNQSLLDTTEFLLDGEFQRDEFQSFVESGSLHFAESSVELGVRGKTYSLLLFPWQYQVFYQVSHPALPVAQIVAIEKREVQLSLSGWQNEEWVTELRIRASERRFVSDYIDIAEYSVDRPLVTEEQTLLALEPGVGWSPHPQWQLFSTLINTGYLSEKSAALPVYPGLLTSVRWSGDVELVGSLFASQQNENWTQSFGAALRVPLRWFDTVFSTNEKLHSLAVHSNHKGFNLGLSLEQRELGGRFSNGLRLGLGVVF